MTLSRVLDIDAERRGRVTPWLHPYSLAANRDLLQRVARARVVLLPAGAVDYLARFPESLRCAPK